MDVRKLLVIHVAMAIYGRAWMEGDFALLTAYYDDTGKPDDTATVSLFGFVGDAEQWLRFEDNWRSVLNLPQFRLPYFHMKEVRQAGQAKERAFHIFKNNPALEQDLCERLLRVIRIRVLESFSATVLMNDYHRLNLEYEVAEQFGTPAAMATAVAIGKFLKWRDHKRPNEPFQIVSDQGMDEWGKLDETIYKEWGFRLIPAKVKETPGLQACDLAAWEFQRVNSGIVRGTITHWSQVRPTFKKLFDQSTFRVDGELRTPWFLIDDAQLNRLIEKFSVPKRQSPPLALPTRGTAQV